MIAVRHILLLAAIAMGGKAPPPTEALIMPAWFWDTPASGVPLAVGYSPSYRDSPDAYRTAYLDAAWRLYADRESVIRGERGSTTVSDGTMDLGGTIHQEIDSAGFEPFLKSVVPLDSFRTDAMRVVLVSTTKAAIDRRRIPMPSSQPSILTSGASQEIAPSYYEISSSWIEAERKARQDLALGVGRIAASDESAGSERLRTVTIQTDAIIQNVLTVARRIHLATGAVMVWVTGSVSPGN